ncbi:putative C6 transcription factor [Aspergillus lucknowensis]|uniref:Fungal-specific transcription factor domain-containing protein n=1 Tax=Aspergillus lucknowensis TaxID=176173 RepID=A0ABR4M1I6_9EURO
MDDDHPQPPISRRRRPALSCTVCRRRKLKCDRSLPCGQCIKSKAPSLCVYSAPKPSQNQASTTVSRSSPSDLREARNDTVSLVGTGVYVFDSKNRVTKPRGRPDEFQELHNRIQTLERALARHDHVQTPESSVYGSVLEPGIRMGPDPISNHVMDLSGKACFRGRNGRTRFRGRSGAELSLTFLHDLGAFLQGRKKDFKAEGSEFQNMKKFRCELRNKEIQEQDRVGQGKPLSLQEMIPPRRIADELLNLYFSTFETTYRILHIPSFFKEYEAYWTSPGTADMNFIAKLLSLMAAASCFINHSTTINGKDTLHDVAIGWVLGVQSWVASLLVSLAKLDILQIHCLLMIARQALAIDGDVVWITSGSLIHSAMMMGLHRDPIRFAKMTPFWVEMRRRLWLTILELELQASMDAGVLPSIDLDQYDCRPPANCDDVDLTEDMLDCPVGKDSTVLTQCSFQTMLAHSLPLRVRIAKAVNSLRFTMSYDEALRLDGDLVQFMNESLVPFPAPRSNPGNPSFARSFMLFLMQRSILTLHRPFSLSVSLSPKYSYSRKVCLEASLEMLTQFELPPPNLQSTRTPCLGQISGGMFRDECFHAAITLCLELSLQNTELGSNSAPPAQNGSLNDLLRSQQDVLLRVLERTQDNFGRRISLKGSGSKAFVFLSMAFASVKAKLNGDDPLTKIEQAAMRGVNVCQHIIRGTPYAEVQTQSEGDISDFSATHTPFGSSTSDMSFDPMSFLSINPNELSSIDFSNIFDAYYRVPELWNPNFLAP